jgi:D-arabinose 1-dehydrogenase-like Zn-dependent alcohol dehydrogenase
VRTPALVDRRAAIPWLGYACGTCEYCVTSRETPGERQVNSVVGTRQDLAEVFQLHAAGRTRITAPARKLDERNTCFEEILAGRVPARLVVEFARGLAEWPAR